MLRTPFYLKLFCKLTGWELNYLTPKEIRFVRPEAESKSGYREGAEK
jgi:hypothetical protein